MGRPWQSHPGTYGQSNPAMPLERTTKSFRHLFIRCPRWIDPFAYGGPSWNTNRPLGAARPAACKASYTRSAAQRLMLAASFCTRFAFIAKGVLGRFNVSLKLLAAGVVAGAAGVLREGVFGGGVVML